MLKMVIGSTLFNVKEPCSLQASWGLVGLSNRSGKLYIVLCSPLYNMLATE